MVGDKSKNQGPTSDPDAKPTPPEPKVEMLLDENVNDRLDSDEGTFEDRSDELLSNDLDDLTLQQLAGAKGARGAVGGLPSVFIDIPGIASDQPEAKPDDSSSGLVGSPDWSDAAHQIAANDALYQFGAVSTGTYALKLIDLISKSADQTIREKAMRQLSEALIRKHVEETDQSSGGEGNGQRSAGSDGLSEEQLKQQIADIAKHHDDADRRALAVAVLYEHELLVLGGSQTDRPSPLNNYDAAAQSGEFHDGLVADLKKTLELPMPDYDYSDKEALKQFDARRQEKIRAARALSYLEGAVGEGDHTQAINAGLVSTIEIPDQEWTSSSRQHSEKPDIKLTTDAVTMLVDRRTALSEDQRAALRSSSNAILDIDFDDRFLESDIARKGNTDAHQAKLSVIDKLGKLYSGFNYKETTEHHWQYQEQKQVAEQILREMLIGKHGWGSEAAMRVSAIGALETFGAGVRDTNLRAIANRLDPEEKEDDHVRARAIQALNSMTDKSIFRRTPEQLQKDGLPNLNVEHLLRTETDPLAKATLLEIAQESLSYRDPADFRTQVEASTYVSELRSVDFVDVNEKDIRTWLVDSRFQYLDQRTIKQDASRETEKYNSGGWLGWNSVRAFFGYGTSEAFEGVRLEIDRDRQLQEMTDFQQLSDRDQQMAIHTLLHLCRDSSQNLIKQEDEALFRTFAAKKLSRLAEITSANNDVVKDKRLLRAAVVLAFDSMPNDMPGEARMDLTKAVNSLTDRGFGSDLKSGDQPSDYTVITPQRAAALFRARLTKEAQNEALALRTDAPVYRLKAAGKYSEMVQLELIDSLYRLRDLGSYKELKERGPDPARTETPAARGSRIDSVRNRAREVVEDLYYGVTWLREDARKKGSGDNTRSGTGDSSPRRVDGKASGDGAGTISGTDDGASGLQISEIPEDSTVRSKLMSEAESIQNQLLADQQERNFEPITRMIFRSQQDYRIGGTDDPRVGVLQQALGHKVERVQLAAAMALSESGLPANSREMVDARDKLYELTMFGQRRVFQKEAGELLVAMKEREYGTDRIRTPEQLIHGVAWMAHTAKPSGGPAEMLKVMQNAMSLSGHGENRNFDVLIDKNNELVKDSYNAAGRIIPITTQDDPRRGKLTQALETSDERVRFAAAQILHTSIVEDDRASAEEQLARLQPVKESLCTVNQEALARAIITANADLPITSVDDPRRQFLLGTLEHDNERVELASAWILSQSSLPVDREAAMKKLAHLAVHSSHVVGREEAMTILSDINSYGNLEDQLFVYNTLRDVMVAKDGPAFVPPFAIPNEYSKAINFFERSPRTALLTICEDGDLADIKNVLMAITSLDQEKLTLAIRAEYDSRVRSRDSRPDFEAARRFTSGVKCASHSPDDQKTPTFREPPLTDRQEAEALHSIVTRLIAAEKEIPKSSSSNVRVRDMRSSLEKFDANLKELAAAFKDVKFGELPSLIDLVALSQTDRGPSWSKPYCEARTLPRWTPSHEIYSKQLFRIEIKEPGVLTDAEASALFAEVGGVYSPASSPSRASVNSDLKQSREESEQSGSNRARPYQLQAESTEPSKSPTVIPPGATTPGMKVTDAKPYQLQADSTDPKSRNLTPPGEATQLPSKTAADSKTVPATSETSESDAAVKQETFDVTKIVELLPRIERTVEGDRGRTKLKSVYVELNDMFSRLPFNPEFNQPLDQQVLIDKLIRQDFSSMTPAELQIAMKLERDVPGFGELTKFKATESIYKDINKFLNTSVVESHDILHELKLSMGPGDPLGIVKVGTDPDHPNEGFPAHPDTISSLIKNGELNVEQFKKMAESGHLKSSLIFEPAGIPDSSSLDKMSNSFDWLYANQIRVANSRNRIDANNQYRFLSDYLNIKKPNWAPDKVADKDLEAYNRRLREVLNLTLQVRNTVEAMQSLDNVRGDFDAEKARKDLEKLTLPGGFHFDQSRKRVTELKLLLPEHLIGTSVNEKPIQDLKDWLVDNRGPVDQAMNEYMRGDFIRYMDLHQKGVVGVKGNGDIAFVEDTNGPVAVFDPDNNLMINRGIDGTTFFYQANPNAEGESRLPYGQEVPIEKLQELYERSKQTATKKPFDYINQKFSVTDSGEYVNIESFKTYYQDHAVNYQHWFGILQADTSDKRQLKFDQYIVAQGQTGREQVIRADRIREFQTIQAFFHHGSKFGSAALDFGMIATGGIGFGASLAAKSTSMAVVNGGRIILGVGGLLDPAFRQMGVTGETVRYARHVAMIADVTQGLGRQGIAALSGGKLLFETAKAAEVAKIIEASKAMRRTESEMRYVFGAADGVWLPLMGTEALHHVERMRGQAPSRYLDRGLKDRGSPIESELTGQATASNPPVGARQSVEKVFAVYGDTINDTAARRIFDESLASLTEGKQTELAAKYLQMFHPSAAALNEWRDQQYAGQWLPLKSASARRARPGDLAPEVTTSKTEKVAVAISLLYLAQKDGKLPEDGVLVKRDAKIAESSFLYKPGLPTMRIGRGQKEDDANAHSVKDKEESDGVMKRLSDAAISGAKVLGGVDIQVLPAETVEQKVTTRDVVRALRDAALDAADPGTQMTAADALFRSGAMPIGRYAGTLLDVINNSKSDRAIREKAAKQLAGALMLKHVEETDPAMSVEEREQKNADSFGLSESHLKQQIATIAKQHNDADTRALAAALLYEHGRELDGEARSGGAVSLESYDGGSESGKFHDNLIADLKKTLELPLPSYQFSDRESLTQFDAQRKEKIRAARALSYLEGGVGESNHTQVINAALVSAIDIPDEQWPSPSRLHNQKPDISVTADAVMMLADRRNLLNEDQRAGLRTSARLIMEIGFDSRVESDSARKGNADSYVAKMQVIENLGKVFPGINYSDNASNQSQYQDEKRMVEQSLQEMLLNREGWGSLGVMRVAAIQGLEKFGPGSRDSNLRTIAKVLAPGEKDQYVRARAIQALSSITERSIFRESPEKFEKSGLPNLNVEHLLRTESDPLAVATLFEIGQESLSYSNPESFRTQVEASVYVNDLRSIDFVDVSEMEIQEWLLDSPFHYLDKRAIEQDAARTTEEANSGGWLGWKSARDFFGFGTSQDYEELKLEISRDKQLEEMSNFEQLSERDQQMAIHTLLHLSRDAGQNLIKQDDEALFRTFAAKKLARLAEVSADANSDVVKDKRLLRAAVVLAFDSMPSDMPGEARMHLIKAVNSLTDRDFGKSSSSGTQPADNTVITPQRAAALFRAQLTKEAQNEALALRPDSPYFRFEPTPRDYSEKVQLELINSLYLLHDLGSYKELNERGSDPVLDPSSRGSRIDSVKERARDVVEDLYYGVAWLRGEVRKSASTGSGIVDSATKQISGNATGDGARTASSADGGARPGRIPDDSNLRAKLETEAESIQTQLVEDQQERNFEPITRKILQSQNDYRIAGIDDPRVRVLHQALRHKVERVQLAATQVLAESGLPADCKEMIDVRDKLYALTEFGQRRIFQKEAGDLLVAMKEREYGIEKIRTSEQLVHGVAWMAHTAKPEGDAAAMLERMQTALSASKQDLSTKSSDVLIDKKNPLVKDSYAPGGQIISITSEGDTRRGKLLQALESKDLRVRFAAAQVLHTSIVEQDRLSAETELARLESAKAGLYTGNQEQLARAIITANADLPLLSKDDPRRQFLLDAIDNDNERVSLASAWMMSQSALPLDRETAMRKLAHLAVHSSHEVGREEAMTVLSDIASYGNLDDQLFAYNTLRDVLVATEGPAAVPPFAIPNEYSRAINYFERSPRSGLLFIREDGSLNEMKDAIMAITGLDKEQLSAAIRSEYDASIRPHKAGADFEAAQMSALFNGVKCASHNPVDQKIRASILPELPLTESQEVQAIDVIVSKLIAQEKGDTSAASNVRIRDLMASSKQSKLDLQAVTASFADGNFDGVRTKWTELSRKDRRPAWSASNHDARRTLPRWTPSHNIDPPDLHRLKVNEHGVMRDEEARALFAGAGSVHDRAPSRLSGSINTDVKRLKALLSEQQPGNYRAVVEALYSTFKDQPLVPYQPDPRRDVLKDALKHQSDRVRMSAAWMLINSAARQDVADGTRVVAETYVNGEVSDIIRGEARALLGDMIFYGGDRERRQALELWQEAYEKSGEQHEERKPPDTKSLAAEDVDQARRYFRHLQETHSEFNLFGRSVEDKKAIVLQMHKALNPDKPMSEAQLDARTMSNYIPLTGVSSKIFTQSPLSTYGGLYPSDPQEFLSGRRSTSAPAIEQLLNPTRSIGSSPFFTSETDATRLDAKKIGPVMAKWMRENRYVGLESAEFKIDPEKGFTFDISNGKRHVLSAETGELSRYGEPAQKQELAKFFEELLQSRPELRSGKGIKPELLADMYVQSLRGRPVELISDTVAGTTSPLKIGMPDPLWRSKLDVSERQAVVSSFEAARKQRDTSHRLNLDWELGHLLDEPPPSAPAFSARWKPSEAASKKVEPPALFRKPAIDRLELFQSDSRTLLPQDFLEAANRNDGTVPISLIENFAHLHGGATTDGETIQVYSRLSKDVSGDYVVKDRSTWKVINENQARKLLRILSGGEKSNH